MSDTLLKIDEFLARGRKARLLLEEETAALDAGIIKMIVDSLPELALGEEFRQKLSAMLADKLDDGKILKVTQALVSELPARAEAILNGLVV